MDTETKRRKLRAEMLRLRAKLRQRSATDAKKEKKEKSGKELYDDVYFKGLEWLNSL